MRARTILAYTCRTTCVVCLLCVAYCVCLCVAVVIGSKAMSFPFVFIASSLPLACVAHLPKKEKILAVLKAIESLFGFVIFLLLYLGMCVCIRNWVSISSGPLSLSHTLLIVMKFILYVAFSLCLCEEKFLGSRFSISVRHNSFTDDSSACRVWTTVCRQYRQRQASSLA